MQSVLIADRAWRDEFGKKLFELQQSGQFCDVIIKTAEDTRLLVHSCVLAASSPLLKSVIESALSDASLGTIMLSSDIDGNTWAHMLEYMYTGSSTVPDNLISSLQSGAKILNINQLITKCTEALSSLVITKSEVDTVAIEGELYSAIDPIKGDETNEVSVENEETATIINEEISSNNFIESAEKVSDIVSQPTEIFTVVEGKLENEIAISEEHISENTNDQTQLENPGTLSEHGVEDSTMEDTMEVQDEMEARNYIDEVNDASTTLDYITTSSTNVPSVSHNADEYKPVDFEDFITTNQAHSPMINMQPSSPENNSPHIVLQPTFHDQGVDNLQQIVLTKATLEQIEKDHGTQTIVTDEQINIHEYELVGYTSNGKKQYRCCLCNALTMDPTAHRPVHTNDSPYVCNEPGCGKTYKRKSALKHHFSQIHSIQTPQKCHKCGKIFNTVYLLKKHLTMTCTDAKPYVCRHCGKSFKVLVRLKYHEGSHAKVKPFKCSICGKGMASKDHLRVHMVSHENGRHECTICNKYFPSNKRLSEHNRQLHALDNPNRCDICERNFKNAICLERHMLRHSNEPKMYLCRICRRGFKNSISCLWHEKKVHGFAHPDFMDVDGDTTCPLCGKILKNKTSLQTHMSTHEEPENETAYQCNQCQKFFPKKKHLMSHIQDVHVDRNMQCPNCDKVFKQEKHLREHMNIHVKPFECSICGGRFSNKRYLEKHLADHKKGLIKQKNYKCPHCDKSFPTATNFRMHISEEHPKMPKESNAPIKKGEDSGRHKPKYIQKINDINGTYNCELCDKVFFQEERLTEHEIKKHIDVNRLLCKVCDVKFISPRTLKIHQFEDHHIGTEELCDNCDRIFYSLEDLNRHNIKVHSMIKSEENIENKYICVICTKMFTSMDELSEHERSHQGNVCCRICNSTFDEIEKLNNHLSVCSELQCVYCLQMFSDLESCRDHVLDHEKGTLYYNCSVCKDSYASEMVLVHHLEDVHGVTSFTPKSTSVNVIPDFLELADIKSEKNSTSSPNKSNIEQSNFKSLLQSFSK